MVVVLFAAGAPGPASAASPPPQGQGAARAAWRQVAGTMVGSPAAPPTGVAPTGAARTASAGDAVTINDPDDVGDPRADILQVGVGSGYLGGLVFTMNVEQVPIPTGTASAVALWGVDTSGDADPDVVVAVERTADGVQGLVFDAASGGYVCDVSATADVPDRLYRAEVFNPGCFGEVRQPAVAGALVYDNGAGAQSTDEAPDGGLGLVRFTRPPAGPLSGGYAIVSRGAGFQRYGAIPPYQCFGPCPPTPPLPVPTATTSGTFGDYIGPRPVVGTARDRSYDPALWAVTDDGEVATQDGAEWYGDASALPLARPVVGMAVRPDRSGYWLVASDGGIFSFGDAPYFGSTGGLRLNKPIVGMASTPSGNGYWLVASDGGIFAFGDAEYHGSTGALVLNRPVVGMAGGLTSQGYWLVASDGGIFAFGVPFYGSTGNLALQQPIVGMAASRSGGGYRFVARDGGIFSFGDSEFHGSGATAGRTDVVGVATA